MESVMRRRLTIIGIVLAVIGLGFVAGGGYAYMQIQDGYDSLQSFSEAQNVTLSYNDDGQLVDRGETEGAQAILALLEDDWQYRATEYMYQMATIIYHTIDGTVEVTLDQAVEYNGETFEAGTYDVEVNGRYWTDFDRMHPLDGPAREAAWSGTVHGLVGELGVGTVTHSTLQMGLGLSMLLAGLGATFMLLGGGLAFAARGKDGATEVKMPDTVPQELVDAHTPLVSA